MANLSSLVHELRERIAASSSTPPNKGEDDAALEIRFRNVLPNLLHAYVVPSSSGLSLSLLKQKKKTSSLQSIYLLFRYISKYIIIWFILIIVFLYIIANEREVIAVLKLLTHTAKNFPGVFYHGKASAVLPVIGRILPFFAEPSFR